MAVCKICGEEFRGDLKKCPKCNAPFTADNNEYLAKVEKFEDVYQKFDYDMEFKVDRKKLTYVCNICGCVNHIDKRRCTRCGKPRPRTEYIQALKLLKKTKKANEDVFEQINEKYDSDQDLASLREEQAQALEQDRILENQEKTLEEKERDLQRRQRQLKEKEMVLYRYENGPVQNKPITQPFVIVPYVNQNQPLYQYNPQQVYKFVPNSFLQNQAVKENKQVFAEGAKPTASDLAILRAKKLEEIDLLTLKIKELEDSREEELKRNKKRRRKNKRKR